MACARCGEVIRLDLHRTRLCAPCRELLIRRPIPLWIWAGAALVLAAMIFNVARVPPKWDALKHRVRADEAAFASDWPMAITHYEALLRVRPGSLNDWFNLGRAYIETGRYKEAAAVLQRLEGQRGTAIDVGRYRELESMLQYRLRHGR